MAAAEGTVGIFALGARIGLKSWLFFLDLFVTRLPVDAPDFAGGLTGEVSREGLGEVAADEFAES